MGYKKSKMFNKKVIQPIFSKKVSIVSDLRENTTVMSDLTPNIHFLPPNPPETGQPLENTSDEEDISSPSNKKVKNAHVLSDSSPNLEIIAGQSVEINTDLKVTEGASPEWPQGISLEVDIAVHPIDSDHGMTDNDALIRGSGGDDPQPKPIKSYIDAVSEDK